LALRRRVWEGVWVERCKFGVDDIVCFEAGAGGCVVVEGWGDGGVGKTMAGSATVTVPVTAVVVVVVVVIMIVIGDMAMAMTVAATLTLTL
jgi:hypothetical protein